MKKPILILGFIDVCFIVWRFTTDISQHNAPIYSSLVESIGSGISFGTGSLFYFVPIIFGEILIASIGVSGWLMMIQNRKGVYLSIFQFPFRLIMLIPPTFFFLHAPINSLTDSLVLSFSMITIFEFFKLFIEIKWLKSKRQLVKAGARVEK